MCDAMERVNIMWNGPYSIDSATARFKSYEDFGVYMITRLWGENSETLLYIGSVYGRDYWRCFADRLAEHKSWLNERRGQIQARIGKIRLRGNKRASYKRTKDVESLLIYVYQPLENWKSTSTYHGRELEIVNLGRKGPLKLEVCSCVPMLK